MLRMLQITAPPGSVIVHYPGAPNSMVPVYYLQYDSSDDEKIRKWFLALLEQHDSTVINTVKQVLTNLTQVKKSDKVSTHDLDSYQIGEKCRRCGKCVGDDNYTDDCS